MLSKAPPEKKLVIKPLKLKPKLPDDFETKNWNRLKEAVQAIQSETTVSCSLEELYHSVEDLCVHNLSTKVFTQLREECDQHALRTLDLLASWSTLDAIAFLDHVGRTWDRFCDQLLLIRQVFLYLDRTYVLTSSSSRSIFDMGLEFYRAHLSKHPEIELKTVEGLLALIDAERNGDAVDRTLLRNLLKMLSSLGIYEDSFQGPFLARSTTYYATEGDRLIQVRHPSLPLHYSSMLYYSSMT